MDTCNHKESLEMRNNVRRAVQALELCWKCQKVSECQKYVLGQTVLVWLCRGCMAEMEKPLPERLKQRSRIAATAPRPASAASGAGPAEALQ